MFHVAKEHKKLWQAGNRAQNGEGLTMYNICMAANAVGKKYSEAKRAYLAGFLDADGAIMATIERHLEKKFRFRVRITLKITQSKKDVIEWFHKTYRCGYIRRNRTTWEWVVRDQIIARDMVKILLPYLQVKRKQAKLALEILKTEISTKNDLVRIARLADALARLNVRSKNRRKNHASMIQEYFSSND